MKTLLLILSLIMAYQGRVVDQNGQPIPYATVYPEAQPEVGTATNNDGFFAFTADLPEHSEVIFSFIGYEKQTMPLVLLRANDSILSTITLKEQPIALEETVVAAKASKQRNKRKQMAALLHAVFVKLEEEFPDENAQYQVVSDVRMLSEGSTWGMEQMIANIVVTKAVSASASLMRRNAPRPIRFLPPMPSSIWRNKARHRPVHPTTTCVEPPMRWIPVWSFTARSLRWETCGMTSSRQ